MWSARCGRGRRHADQKAGHAHKPTRRRSTHSHMHQAMRSRGRLQGCVRGATCGPSATAVQLFRSEKTNNAYDFLQHTIVFFFFLLHKRVIIFFFFYRLVLVGWQKYVEYHLLLLASNLPLCQCNPLNICHVYAYLFRGVYEPQIRKGTGITCNCSCTRLALTVTLSRRLNSECQLPVYSNIRPWPRLACMFPSSVASIAQCGQSLQEIFNVSSVQVTYRVWHVMQAI